jgi:GNAT superfamily N-acetyltransferase
METSLAIVVASTNELRTQQFAELRKLWIHGVQMDTHAVGWLPTSVFDSRAKTDEVTACYRNADLVGWCVRGESTARKVLKIYQIWVRPDARIIEHGRALVDYVARIAGEKNCGYLEAWVAEDLEANYFWPAIGFTRTVWRWGRGRSFRKIWRWVKLAGKRAGNSHEHPQNTPGKDDNNQEWAGIERYDN